MSWEIQELIKHYASEPVNNFEMEDYTIKREEWNFICDDSIEVFLKIENNKIEKFSYIWELSFVWIASASIVAEEIEWKNIEEILSRDYEFLKSLWFDVSTRRKRAAILPILATRNALHEYINDWIEDDFDDLADGC